MARTLVSAWMTVMAAMCFTAVVQAAEPPAALTQAETDGWRQWLHSLEQSVAGRGAAGLEESNLLYPLDVPMPAGDAARPYRHLAIAKAIDEMEGKGRGQKSTTVRSPLLALAHARNYLNLSEYDSALTWFQLASELDSAGDFSREIGREVLAAAVCAGDSLKVRRAVSGTLANGNLDGRDGEIVLAFRVLLALDDSASLEILLNRTAAIAPPLASRVMFWRAYALSWLGRRAECLAAVRELVVSGGLSRGLNERERSWVLVATADLLLLEGAKDAAAVLYESIAESTVPELKLWGQLQKAALDFLAHRFGAASNGFRAVCEADRQGTWGPHACAMADMAADLDRLLSEGERYGAAASYSP